MFAESMSVLSIWPSVRVIRLVKVPRLLCKQVSQGYRKSKPLYYTPPDVAEYSMSIAGKIDKGFVSLQCKLHFPSVNIFSLKGLVVAQQYVLSGFWPCYEFKHTHIIIDTQFSLFYSCDTSFVFPQM